MKKSDTSIHHPRVTVLLPVYNGTKYIRESIQSILKQSFTDFELLIIDDGSTDDTARIIRNYQDARIRIITLSKNQGIVTALNIGLEKSHGEYIARMDSDDISLPKRLESQVQFLDHHPGIVVCGTAVIFREVSRLPIFNLSWEKNTVVGFSLNSAEIACELLFRNVIAHPSAMMRAKLFSNYHYRYSHQFPHAEDYDLWIRLSKNFPLANLPDVLLILRSHKNRVSSIHYLNQKTSTNRIKRRLINELGIHASPLQLSLHEQICSPTEINPAFLYSLGKWLNLLEESNRRYHLYSETAFRKSLEAHWQQLYLKSLPRKQSMTNKFAKYFSYKFKQFLTN